jgi:hypothetical protein
VIAHSIIWLVAAALIALGWMALGRICAHCDRSSCQAALVLCALGMTVGLAIDANEGRLAMLDALCLAGQRSQIYWIQLHWQQLPAMHAGMLAGALIALPLPLNAGYAAPAPLSLLLRGFICCVCMLAGMSLGVLTHALVASDALSTSIMVALMIVGMTWGTVLGIVTASPFLEHSRPPKPFAPN